MAREKKELEEGQTYTKGGGEVTLKARIGKDSWQVLFGDSELRTVTEAELRMGVLYGAKLKE